MNCRRSSQLLSEALERELTPEERAAIEEHLAICPACTRCRRQFAVLRQALRRLATSGEAS